MVEGVHVEGQIIEFAVVVGNGTVGISVERYKAVHEVPYLFVVSMENVCTILMNVYAFHIFAIDVTTQVRAFIYHKAFLSLLRGLLREGGTKEARAYYEIIVFNHCFLLYVL